MNRCCRLFGSSILVGAFFGTAGCDLIEKMRATVHPGAEDAPEFGHAGLRVEVEPPDGISILLDGRRVASLSPYKSKRLKAGAHRLEVRAMGYHSVTLPLLLTDHETVIVPVSLRRRPGAKRFRPDDEEEPDDRPPMPDPPKPLAPALPPGVRPIVLQIVATPKVPILLDHSPITGRKLVLKRTHGTITVGVARIEYRIGSAGILVLTVDEDGAKWTKDRTPIAHGRSFKLHRGPVRLRRISTDGTDQTVLVRR